MVVLSILWLTSLSILIRILIFLLVRIYHLLLIPEKSRPILWKNSTWNCQVFHLFHPLNVAMSIHHLYLLKFHLLFCFILWENMTEQCLLPDGSALLYRNIMSIHDRTVSFKRSHCLWCCNSMKLLKLGRGCTKQLRTGVASSPGRSPPSSPLCFSLFWHSFIYNFHEIKYPILKRKDNKTKQLKQWSNETSEA